MPLLSREHCVFGPHGDGLHGFCGGKHCVSGGLPSNSGRQKQTGVSPMTRQPVFGPHGFGVHSLPSGTRIGENIHDIYIDSTHFPPQKYHLTPKNCAHSRIHTAILEWIAGQSLGTEANRVTAVQLAHGINATRIRFAEIGRWTTADASVARISGRALAGCLVVVHLAQCKASALAW